MTKNKPLPLKIVFFGSQDPACISLEALIREKSAVVACVVTKPDRVRGRGLKIMPQPVKACAEKFAVPVLQPQALDREFYARIKTFKPDLFVVVNFGTIFKKEFFTVPSLYAVNLHFSLLPAYRGASPVNWALINGEKKTGVTVFKIRESLDRGDIIASREVSIRDDETAGALLQRLSYEGADVLKEVVAAVAHEPSRLTFTAQEECRASYARKLKKNDGLIEWNMPARDIYNRIRGLSPWPGACTYLDGRYVKLWEARVVQGRDGASSPAAGTIIEASHKEGILVKTGAGYLAVTRVQPQARKIMTASQFISGYALRAGMRFSSP